MTARPAFSLEPDPASHLASIGEPNIARVASNAVDHLGTLAHKMILYMISRHDYRNLTVAVW